MTLKEVLEEMSKGHYKMTSDGKKAGFSDRYTTSMRGKSIRYGLTYLVKDGEIIEQTIELSDGIVLDLENNFGFEEKKGEDFFEGLEERFKKYYSSVPHKGDEYVKSDFMARPYKDLHFSDFTGEESRRCTTRYELEGYVLTNILKGNVSWDESKRYWKSRRYKKCILDRAWL